MLTRDSNPVAQIPCRNWAFFPARPPAWFRTSNATRIKEKQRFALRHIGTYYYLEDQLRERVNHRIDRARKGRRAQQRLDEHLRQALKAAQVRRPRHRDFASCGCWSPPLFRSCISSLRPASETQLSYDVIQKTSGALKNKMAVVGQKMFLWNVLISTAKLRFSIMFLE